MAPQSQDICIVDYGLGNLASVGNALRQLKCNVTISCDYDILEKASGLILPGVGAFGEGMSKLRSCGLIESLNQLVLIRKKPILGICLGMQLMASRGYEHGEFEGLDWFEGKVIKIFEDESFQLKLPHIGWNEITKTGESELTKDTNNGACFYFVHSYQVQLTDTSEIKATCEYGTSFAAIIQRENIFGAQFHPEKSQKNGLHLLKNFVEFTKTSAF